MTRSPPATSTTAAHRRDFSSAVRVGDSPVVPATTRVSVPLSSRWRARRWAPSTSRLPSGLNGVAMAVSTRPKRPGMAGPPSDGKRPRRPAAPPRRQPLRILLGPSTPTGDLGEDTALLLGSLAARYLSFAFICIHKLLSTPGWLWPVRSEADDRAAGGPERAGACRRPAPGQRRRGPFGGRQPGANGRRGRPRAGRRRPGRPVPGPLEPLGERARGPRRRPDRGGQPPAGGRRRIPRDRPDRAPGVALRPGAGARPNRPR